MRVSLSRKSQVEPDSSQPECPEYSSCMFWRRYYRDEAASHTGYTSSQRNRQLPCEP